MQKKKIVAIILLAVLLLCVVGYLIYSRPMTIQQRYPTLDLEKCTKINGYYEIAGEDFTKFTIDPDGEAFDTVCSLVCEQGYSRRLKDVFHPDYRSHSPAPGDFAWEVVLTFEGTVLPDGSTNPGGIVDIHYWYGDLTILYADSAYDSEMHYVRAKKQEAWANEILSAIQ